LPPENRYPCLSFDKELAVTAFIFNAIGTIGVAVILGTYFMLQTGRFRPEQLRYSITNFFGSGMILISLFHDWNLPSVIVEAAWVAISVLGIVRWWLKRKKRAASTSK
jgi:hypothetical protein